MAENDVKKYFNSLLTKVTGLYFILVTDRDGVPLLRCTAPKQNIGLSLFPPSTIASEQASKLGLGKNKTIISMYSKYQVIQMNKLPLILTFVGSENCNTGHLLSLEEQIDKYLEDIKIAVTESSLN